MQNDYWDNRIVIPAEPVFSVTGVVAHGKKLGRTIDFPTANIFPGADFLCPAYGVYFSEILLDGKKYYGITNVGTRPTVSEEKKVSVETYIFDFNKEVYGEKITVSGLVHTRPEIRFGSVEELRAQLTKDKKMGQELLLQINERNGEFFEKGKTQ